MSDGNEHGRFDRLARRLGLTEGQVWTIVIMVVIIALLLYGLRNLDAGALS